MFNFGNLEKIESVILRPCKNLIIKNVVQFGSSSIRDKKRYDAVRSYSYQTNKYSDHNYVGSLYLETSDFLVFQYTNYDKGKKINEEVFISYPQFKKLKNHFNEFYKIAMDQDVYIQSEKDNSIFINDEFMNYENKITNMVNGKSMSLIFDTIDHKTVDDSIECEPAVSLFISEEEYIVTMSFDVFEMLLDFLNSFNLLTSSQQLINFAYMTEIANAFNLKNEEHIPDYAVDAANYGADINRKLKVNFK